MIDGEVNQLRDAIEPLHDSSAIFVQFDPIKEAHAGAVVWESIIHTFDLKGDVRPPVRRAGQPKA